MWQAPHDYPTPASLLSGDVIQDVGNVISTEVLRPVLGGGTYNAGDQFQISILPDATGFIKPNSMFLRMRVLVDISSVTAGVWGFAGQSLPSFGNAAGVNQLNPASSVLSRVSVQLPGGQTMDYQQYGNYEWSICLNHMLSREYVRTDLKRLMQTHTTRAGDPTILTSRIAYVMIPLDIPIFNASAAFPLCLITDPIMLQFTLNTIQALTANILLGGFSVSEISLVYTQLNVDLDTKQKLIRRGIPYSIAVKDRTFLGTCPGGRTTQLTISAPFSSLRAIVGSNIRTRGAQTTNITVISQAQQLISWSLYIDGKRAHQVELDNEVITFYELKRALSEVMDLNFTSDLVDQISTTTGALRDNFVQGAFAFGCSTSRLNSSSCHTCGIPVNTIQVQFYRDPNVSNSVPTLPDKWTQDNFSYTQVGNTCITYIWAFHDSIATIGLDGVVTLRK